MKNIFTAFKFKPRKKIEVDYNVPEVAGKVRNALSEYIHKIPKEQLEKDPLAIRINVEKYDYISEVEKSRNIWEKGNIKLKQLLYKTNIISENEKVLNRTNHHLRPFYYGNYNPDYKIPFGLGIFLTGLFSFTIGYCWARMKYDIYTRRYMYSYFPSLIIALEVIDSKLVGVLNMINEYLPLDLNESHFHYILSRKASDKIKERRLKSTVDEILDDPDMIELNKLLKKIR